MNKTEGVQHISQRGYAAAEKPVRVDLELYSQAIKNKYHKDHNPDGAFPMNVAENHLCWDLLREKMESITRSKNIPEWVASYGDPAGVRSFREAVAGFLSDFLVHQEVPADTLACSAGATSVIEMTSFLLADPGDTAVIPAPSYPVYTMDIGTLPGVKRFDLQTHHHIHELKDGFPIHISQLEEARKSIEAQGSRFRMLILTTPDNPTGGIFAESQLEKLADWCNTHKIHMIVNEIYGLSRIDVQHPEIVAEYPHPISFVSFARLMEKKKSPYLHFWYSFSKDLGISGFRIGLLHTYNQELIQAYRNAGMPHCISNYTQWVMQEVLANKAFMQSYIAASQKALTEAYIAVIRYLKALQIPFTPSYGSLFVWLDASEFLHDDSEDGQHALWLEIFEKTGILLTPGAGFGHSKKGLFRMVITSVEAEALEVAMERFSQFVRDKRAEKK